MPRSLIVVGRSLRTARGRQRLRLSAYARLAPAVRAAAVAHRRTLVRRTRVVAVVGSFGKTTAARAVAAALGLPVSRYGSRNSGVAVAAAALRIRPGDRHAVIEVGISGEGQMARYARLIRPDIAVVTCVGSEHLSSFRTLEATRAEKAKMVEALPLGGLAVLNGDDLHVLWMRDATRARVITYGFGVENDVRASGAAPDGWAGARFTLHVGGEVHDVRTQLIGRQMVYPVLAAVAVAHAEGLELGPVLAAMAALEPTANRLEPIRHPSGALLLLDAFKGALETIHAALNALDELPARRKIVVLGDVEEPPGSQGPIYKEVGRHAAHVAERVYYLGGKTNLARLRAGTIEGGLPREALIHVRRGSLEAAERLGPELRAGDVVLIKGRSTEHFERIALALLGTNVGCEVRLCRRRHDCETCPLLRGE